MPKVITEQSREEGYARMWNWLEEHKDVSSITSEEDLTQMLISEFQSPTHAYDLAVALVEGPAKDTVSKNIAKKIEKVPVPLGISPKAKLLHKFRGFRRVRIKRKDGRVQHYTLLPKNLKKYYTHKGHGLYVRKR